MGIIDDERRSWPTRLNWVCIRPCILCTPIKVLQLLHVTKGILDCVNQTFDTSDKCQVKQGQRKDSKSGRRGQMFVTIVVIGHGHLEVHCRGHAPLENF